MSFHCSTRFALSTALLILAALACSTPSVVVPTTITAVAFPTATALPQPTNTSVATVQAPASPSASAPPSPSAAPTGTPTPTQVAGLTGATKSQTNIRSGPGANYAILGSLAPGLSVRLTGRTTDKSWWQIEFPANPDGHAWVLASSITLGTGTDTQALPIVSAPPTPTRAPVVPTRTASAPTATVVSNVIPVLRADRSQLSAGECTTLRWDVEGVSAVYLNMGNGELPVTGHDTSWICPDQTTVYTLRVVNTDDTTRQYAFTVTVSENCGDTPIIARFEASDLEVKAGDNVTLSWDVSCAQSVYFKEGSGGRQPVTGHDSADVQPTENTVYRLIAVGKNGGEIRQDITITVVP